MSTQEDSDLFGQAFARQRLRPSGNGTRANPTARYQSEPRTQAPRHSDRRSEAANPPPTRPTLGTQTPASPRVDPEPSLSTRVWSRTWSLLFSRKWTVLPLLAALWFWATMPQPQPQPQTLHPVRPHEAFHPRQAEVRWLSDNTTEALQGVRRDLAVSEALADLEAATSLVYDIPVLHEQLSAYVTRRLLPSVHAARQAPGDCFSISELSSALNGTIARLIDGIGGFRSALEHIANGIRHVSNERDETERTLESVKNPRLYQLVPSNGDKAKTLDSRSRLLTVCGKVLVKLEHELMGERSRWSVSRGRLQDSLVATPPWSIDGACEGPVDDVLLEAIIIAAEGVVGRDE